MDHRLHQRFSQQQSGLLAQPSSRAKYYDYSVSFAFTVPGSVVCVAAERLAIVRRVSEKRIVILRLFQFV